MEDCFWQNLKVCRQRSWTTFQVNDFLNSVPGVDSNVKTLSRIQVKAFASCSRGITISSRFLPWGARLVNSFDIFIPKLGQHPIGIELSLVCRIEQDIEDNPILFFHREDRTTLKSCEVVI